MATSGNENERLLEQLSRSRDELNHFVRALSHDMTANFMLLDSSFSQLKRSLGKAEPEELAQLVAHVDACLRESKRFLDDMVALARTGSVQMEPCRVDLEEVVDEVLFEQREVINSRRVALDVRRPLGAVWCNRHRVKQALTNVIRNALKHGCSPTQPVITVMAGVEGGTSDGRSMVALRIHDNGAGIDPKCHEEIFVPGRRLPHAVGDGSGMGLAIVRKIVEHYDGTAAVDGSCPSGTAIVLRLPTPVLERVPQPHYDSRPSELSGRTRGTGNTAIEKPRSHRHHRTEGTRGHQRRPAN